MPFWQRLPTPARFVSLREAAAPPARQSRSPVGVWSPRRPPTGDPRFGNPLPRPVASGGSPDVTGEGFADARIRLASRPRESLSLPPAACRCWNSGALYPDNIQSVPMGPIRPTTSPHVPTADRRARCRAARLQGAARSVPPTLDQSRLGDQLRAAGPAPRHFRLLPSYF
jgi:hypothetical protein